MNCIVHILRHSRNAVMASNLRLCLSSNCSGHLHSLYFREEINFWDGRLEECNKHHLLDGLRKEPFFLGLKGLTDLKGHFFENTSCPIPSIKSRPEDIDRDSSTVLERFMESLAACAHWRANQNCCAYQTPRRLN
jgi:hypothetical protein